VTASVTININRRYSIECHGLLPLHTDLEAWKIAIPRGLTLDSTTCQSPSNTVIDALSFITYYSKCSFSSVPISWLSTHITAQRCSLASTSLTHGHWGLRSKRITLFRGGQFLTLQGALCWDFLLRDAF